MKKVPITSVCDFQGGTQPPKEEWEIDCKPGYIRMLQIRDFTQKKESNVEYVRISNKIKTCTSNDIMIGRYGASIGKILTGLDGAYNVAMIKTIPDENVLSRDYLYYVLKGVSFQNFISNIGSRAAQAGFNKEDLSKFQISLPPLDYQIRIAAVLSRAEKLITKRKESIKSLDEFLKSTFLEMFGDPVRNEKGWETRSLEKIVTPGRIVTYGIVQAGPHIPDGIPYIKTGDIKNGKIEKNNLSRTSPEIVSKYKRSEVNCGDIIMSIRATVGTLAILPNDLDGANLTQGTARISPGTDVNKYYLYYYISSEFIQNWLNKQIKGTTFREITLARLRMLPVLMPPVELQKKFAAIVEKVEAMKVKYNESLVEMEKLYGGLSQRAFRGEL